MFGKPDSLVRRAVGAFTSFVINFLLTTFTDFHRFLSII